MITPSIIDAIWYSVVAILITSYGFKEKLIKKKRIDEVKGQDYKDRNRTI